VTGSQVSILFTTVHDPVEALCTQVWVPVSSQMMSLSWYCAPH
jgi:hypothetical protein